MGEIISSLEWDYRLRRKSMQKFVTQPEKGALPVFSYKKFKRILEEKKKEADYFKTEETDDLREEAPDVMLNSATFSKHSCDSDLAKVMRKMNKL